MAIDKPAGMIVHGDGTGERTLTDYASIFLNSVYEPSLCQKTTYGTGRGFEFALINGSYNNSFYGRQKQFLSRQLDAHKWRVGG